jgi:hypothetical protein
MGGIRNERHVMKFAAQKMVAKECEEQRPQHTLKKWKVTVFTALKWLRVLYG